MTRRRLVAFLAASTVLVACGPGPSPVTGATVSSESAARASAPAAQPSLTAAPATWERYRSPRADSEVVPAPRIIGYFSSWGIYARNYHVKTIVSSGAAENLMVINYAFAGPFDQRCILADPQADVRRIYGRADSVDGVGNGQDVVRGHFGQLMRLKAMLPDLKVLISVGGWTLSAGFSDAALAENREDFVASCVDLFLRGNLPDFERGAAAGLFDGIDIDWEYPAAEGRRGNIYRPEDTQNFTLLLAEFRRQLDEIDPGQLLTIAAPAGEERFSLMQLDRIHPYLDWINVMSYDYHGAWEPQGPTNFHAPLYGSPEDPSAGRGLNADSSLRAFLDAGVPADKLNLGIPFFGRGWTGVEDTNRGLYQNAAEPAAGLYEVGVNDYGLLRRSEAPVYYDSASGGSWSYDGTTFWGFDDPTSIAEKTAYVQRIGLGGVMFWELAGDTRDGELTRAIAEGLFGTP